MRKRFFSESGLAKAAALPQDNIEILIIPVITNFRHQSVVITTFERDSQHQNSISENSMSHLERTAITCITSHLFYKLNELGALSSKRKGELTNREREVLSLSALGKKSIEIGKTLDISERTVVTHLQNASLKLGAKNRTEAVLHAIRFNQIGPGAGLGFYQLETEIYPD